MAIRAQKAEDWKYAQLDKTTIYDHMKIIERRILRTTEDFLRDRNVDTSVFEKQAINIINSGVFNMGGKTVVRESLGGENKQVIFAARPEGQSA